MQRLGQIRGIAMALMNRRFAGKLLAAVLAVAAPAWGQSRIRRGASPSPAPAPAAVPAAAPSPAAVPAAPPSFAVQPTGGTPQSLLQEPAREADIVFAADRLSIHAENSSLTAILHKIAVASGMRVTGLGNDERVFGTFGPGSPRDVLADLLNGTAYNQLLLGDLSNGAPRELILTPATRAGDAPAAPAAAPTGDEAAPEQEVSDVAPPPPPDVTPAPQTPSAAQGVRTPQQLFEQLQQMRQAQQQEINQPQQPAGPQP